MNFADFNTPIPWTAYIDGVSPIDPDYCPEGIGKVCTRMYQGPASADVIFSTAASRYQDFQKIIVDAEFRPTLVAPPQMRAMDPEWDQCVLPLGGLYDPPLSLPTANGVLEEGEQVAMPPEPGAGVNNEQPPRTTNWVSAPTDVPDKPDSPPGPLSGDEGSVQPTGGEQPESLPYPYPGNPSQDNPAIALLALGSHVLTLSVVPAGIDGGFVLPNRATLHPGEAQVLEGSKMSLLYAVVVNGTATMPLLFPRQTGSAAKGKEQGKLPDDGDDGTGLGDEIVAPDGGSLELLPIQEGSIKSCNISPSTQAGSKGENRQSSAMMLEMELQNVFMIIAVFLVASITNI